jgi:hypothetical protein
MRELDLETECKDLLGRYVEGSEVGRKSRKREKEIYGISGFGGPEEACWLPVAKFAGSNPAETIGFFRAKKSPARLPSERNKSRRSHVVDLRHVKEP